MKSEYDFSNMKGRKNPYIKPIRKHFSIVYILPILVLIIFLIGSLACDSRIGQPDIRKEFIEGDKPDYFGYKWDLKW